MTGEGVDRLLAEIAGRGLMLHNLFQLDGRTWRANLRYPHRHCYAYGEGRSAVQALQQALAAVPGEGPGKGPVPGRAVQEAPAVVPRTGRVKIVRRSA